MNRAPSPRWFPLPSARRRPAHESMPADRQAASGQGRLPAIAGTNGRSVVQKPFQLLLPGEACKFLAPRVVLGHERFLAVKNRRVGPLRVIEHIQLPRPQREHTRVRHSWDACMRAIDESCARMLVYAGRLNLVVKQDGGWIHKRRNTIVRTP